jgi:DNA invertase Pin-like site-specific DNA recombinase
VAQMEKIMYLRKSQKDNTVKNETVEETLERHEHQLQEFALKEFGHYIEPEYIFREVISGGDDLSERSAFQEVLKLVEQNKVSHCLFLDTARISRTGIYGAGDIINVFYYTNTLICTPTKTYDLSDEYDKKFLEMELLQSADFLNYVKKIFKRGREHSVKNLGHFIGSVAPYGYDREKLDKGFTLKANEDAKTVRMIFDMCLEGKGSMVIANHLNESDIKPAKNDEWTSSMVKTILYNITYAGMLTIDKRKIVKKIKDGKVIKTRPVNEEYGVYKGLHTGIVTLEEFYMTQKRLQSHPASKVPKSKELKNPLSGLIFCSKCGRSMQRKHQKSKRGADLFCAVKSCNTVSNLLVEVEDAVIDKLKTYLKEFNHYLDNYEEEVKKVVTGNLKTIRKLEKDIDKLKVRLDSVMEAYELKDYTREQFLKRKKEIEDNITELENKKISLENNKQEDKIIKYQKLIPKLSLCVSNYDNLSIVNKNKLLKTIINKIEYTKTEQSTRKDKKTFKLRVYLNI